MVEYLKIHLHQSSLNKLKQFRNDGESYGAAIERLMDMEDEVISKGSYVKEFRIVYGDVDKLFRVEFGNDFFKICDYNSQAHDWDLDVRVWLRYEKDSERKSVVEYLVKFMEKFVRDEANFIMLDKIGDSVTFDDITIERNELY